MNFEISTALVSGIGAAISALCALWGYFNEKRIRRELKADERIIIGKPHHPSYINLKEHRDCILEIPIHNVSTSKRVFITKVQVFDQRGKPIDFAWAGKTDHLGNTPNEGGVLKIEDTQNLYIRETLGKEITYAVIKIFHTFSNQAQVITFDEYEDFKQLR